MQAALKRVRDRRQPADSGEFQAVPIRFITLKPARGPAYGSRAPGSVPGRHGPVARFLAILVVAALQTGFALAGLGAAVVLSYAVPDGLGLLLLFALPALSTALTCAVVAPVLAWRHDRWKARGLLLVSKATGLWVLIVPVAYLFMARSIDLWPEYLLALVVFAMAGAFLFVLSLPGLLVLIVFEGLFERIARLRRRRASARYYLSRGWRAP